MVCCCLCQHTYHNKSKTLPQILMKLNYLFLLMKAPMQHFLISDAMFSSYGSVYVIKGDFPILYYNLKTLLAILLKLVFFIDASLGELPNWSCIGYRATATVAFPTWVPYAPFWFYFIYIWIIGLNALQNGDFFNFFNFN